MPESKSRVAKRRSLKNKPKRARKTRRRGGKAVSGGGAWVVAKAIGGYAESRI